MVIEGTERLSDILNELEQVMQDNPLLAFFAKINLFLPNKVKDIFIIYMLELSILIYVKNGTLTTNNSYESLSFYTEKILAIDNFFTILFLRALPQEIKETNNIHWIVVEKNVSITKSIALSLLTMIDAFLDRTGQNTVGRLNYLEIEKLITDIIRKDIIKQLFKHKNSKNIFASLLNIFSSSKKNKYATKKDIINFNAEEAKMSAYNKFVFRPECPLCHQKKSIVLNDSVINGHYEAPEYMLQYIRNNNKKYVSILCKSCRNIDNVKPVFVREIEKIPTSNKEKDIAFLAVMKQQMEVENNGGLPGYITEEISAEIGLNYAK